MVRLKLDQDTLGLSSLMEKIARVRVKDCFKDENSSVIYFVVEAGQLGKAVGKGGVNIKKVQDQLGKKIKVVEYRSSVINFIKSFIYPLKVDDIVEENDTIILKDSSKKTKSLLIGREGRNLSIINRAVKRFFNKDVKVE